MDNDLKDIKGIGDKKKKILEEMGIFSIDDLINYFPVRYEDRSKIKKLSEIEDGETCLARIRFMEGVKTSYIRKNMNITSAMAYDDSGKIRVSFFNQAYIKNKINTSDYFYIYGKFEKNKHDIKISSPLIEKKLGKDIGVIYPIYRLKKGITNKDLKNFIKIGLEKSSDKIKNIIPHSLILDRKLLDKKEALFQIHMPTSFHELDRARTSLAFEEVLVSQLSMNEIKLERQKSSFIRFERSYLVDDFIKNLGFNLTQAQKSAIDDIISDMEKPVKMNRLVQGDVGSGKTVIAEAAMINALANGYQVAFMAPTEILASQHYSTFIKDYKAYGIKICFLKSDLKESEKKELLLGIKEGNYDLIVGTHAIIQDGVFFKKLGLVITDEQHRFGVKQRKKISDKGESPDSIVMSATPIPRSLALTFYGDLDVSIVDQMPEGRKSVLTYAVDFSYEERIINFIKKQIKEGFQAYIVCPLVKDSENFNLTNLIDLYKRLSKGYLKNIATGLIYGEMDKNLKEENMEKFLSGEIKVLISTTVIEVGVNVPRANTIVIYNAERFGLSQLHQLRGRVGRSDKQSYCILMHKANKDTQIDRLKAMVKINDGFELAKRDLEMRGSGDILGIRQSGMPSFKLVDLARDYYLIKDISLVSKFIIENDLIYSKEYENLYENVKIFKEKIRESIVFN